MSYAEFKLLADWFGCTTADMQKMVATNDWCMWRQVEEKLNENSELLCEYIDTLMCRTELGNCTVRLVLEDLPTRAKALYIAYHSLHANS